MSDYIEIPTEHSEVKAALERLLEEKYTLWKKVESLSRDLAQESARLDALIGYLDGCTGTGDVVDREWLDELIAEKGEV